MMVVILSVFALVAMFRVAVEAYDGIRGSTRIGLRRALLTLGLLAAVFIFHYTTWSLWMVVLGWACFCGLSLLFSRPLSSRLLRDIAGVVLMRAVVAFLLLYVVQGVYVERVVHPLWLIGVIPLLFAIIYAVSVRWVFGRWLEQVPIEMPYDHDLRERFNPKHIGIVKSKVLSLPMNALFIGLFSTGRVWLSDRLVAGLNSAELKAIVLHELGHATRKHLRVRLALLIIAFAVLFAAVSFAFGYFTIAEEALVAFLAVSWTALTGMEILVYYVAQRQEFAADDFAAEAGFGEALASALNVIRMREPERAHTALYHRLFVSHPPQQDRIRRLTKPAKEPV